LCGPFWLAKDGGAFFRPTLVPPYFGALKIPKDILFFGASEPELWALAAARVSKSQFFAEPISAKVALAQSLSVSPLAKYVRSAFGSDADFSKVGPDKMGTRIISEALSDQCGITASSMFSNREQLDSEFKSGTAECIYAAITNLEVVSEESLDWKQVTEFRSDEDAKKKFRRMRNWLDSEMVGKPISYVTDAIGTRLEDYNWSLRKHGIQTLTGAVSDLLNPRFIAAAGPIVGGTWFAAGTGLAELAAGIIAIGKIGVSVTNRLVDLADRKRGQGSEVAFVHELKKLAK
jgi:hypothetical protein